MCILSHNHLHTDDSSKWKWFDNCIQSPKYDYSGQSTTCISCTNYFKSWVMEIQVRCVPHHTTVNIPTIGRNVDGTIIAYKVLNRIDVLTDK